ncbi:hypothetical protein SNE25_02115 [Mucilaginibacter sabulilitoris]|uniref:BZIP transcription factor n=1 Tax=Mucilaginibacter sabulilitoris TaxID=1173583 RepID=A0ABZ0TN13_9SPHI|nr:hypothetical protein [Mucilaginibacter sabulilitoris]WPU94317.1 hypothetical protein SNE25_02115 [Mucilaginibacter sabulilitoris]
MKKIALTLLVFLSISRCAHAQWVNGTNLMYYTGGNVGIGTTIPVSGLSVEAAQNAAMAPLTSLPNGSAWIGATSTTGGISIGQFGGTYGYIQSRNKGIGSGAYKLALNPLGGFVGVGTTAPASALHVIDANATLLTLERNAGATNMNIQYKNNVNSIFAGLDVNGGFSIGTTANFTLSSKLTATIDGNVGIGIFTPTTKLQVRELTDSKPGGVTQPSKSVFKLSRSGTSGYSYNESAEFRIGHGGPGAFGSKLDLFINGANNINDTPDQQAMTWLYNGNVGIGVTNPQNKLDVNGRIHSQSVLIDMNGWSDYVFRKDYQLRSLAEIKTYIDQNQHLPEIPSEKQIAKEGLNLGEMNKLLMKKVEELTLYLIEKDEQLQQQGRQMQKLQEEVQQLVKSSSKTSSQSTQ